MGPKIADTETDAYASDVKTENASSPKLRGKQWGAMTKRGSKIVFKVHSFLKLCFAQSSLDSIWGYFQLKVSPH